MNRVHWIILFVHEMKVSSPIVASTDAVAQVFRML